jgi:hypothetical protein
VVGDDAARGEASVEIAALLLQRGMDIDSVHGIPDDGSVFPATPLWYAYARGRNEALYTYLPERGANPQNCMFAIVWNDDVAAAELFQRHGAEVDPHSGDETPFTAAYLWRRFAVAEWFLRNGADVDHADKLGCTALYHAVRRKYGADPERGNAAGVSPRALAETNRQRKLLSVLAEGGSSA